VCAGLHADRLAAMTGEDPEPQIVPFRGDYHRLRPDRRHLVRGLIYPVPDPRYPFLGIHLTLTVSGDVLVGPNAALAFAREGYRLGDVVPSDLLETARWPGFRRFAAAHWRTGLDELRRSARRSSFIAEARRFIPELEVDDLQPGWAGVRAQALDADGSLVDDFRFSGGRRLLHVRNAPSPAATSSFAIGEHIADRVLAA
jgi:(S)-2-hydroxyglutarate dehydrogenase